MKSLELMIKSRDDEPTWLEEELDTLLAMCKENWVSLNDYLVAKMMIDAGTDSM